MLLKKKDIQTIKELALKYYVDRGPKTCQENHLAEAYISAVEHFLNSKGIKTELEIYDRPIDDPEFEGV
jgi:hypothetical protein